MKRQQADLFASPYERAVEQALADLAMAKEHATAIRSQLSTADSQVAELTQLVQGLLAMIPEERRAPYAAELRKVGTTAAQAARAGPTLNNVVQLFRDDPKRVWEAAEVQEALSARATQADPKSVYNALAYLERTGRLKRISRGRYLIVDVGVGIELDPDRPDVGPLKGGVMED